MRVGTSGWDYPHWRGDFYPRGLPRDRWLERLTAWAERIARWSDEGHPVWAYFNNDVGGHAVRDAARLRSLLQRRGAL